MLGMQGSFIKRNVCPACQGKALAEIYRAPLDTGPVHTFIAGYYEGVDLTPLRGGEYILVECRDCACIFQKDIPNEELSRVLYGEWLSTPELVELSRTSPLEIGAYTAS